MQATLSREDTHTERMMNKLTSQDHKAFFLAAASKSQMDRTFDSEDFETSKSKTAEKPKRGKADTRWKWKP